ncbi:MAG: chorismate pyruvate-lyase family protein [Chloroflexi bacterium]|nr:chorismate pyruvate-lyase family protein [Chloroflexota bacterium]
MENGLQQSIDMAVLNPLERILLITDGTVTEILQAYYREPINLIKLSEKISTNREIDLLDVRVGEEVLERQILLQGRDSGRTYIYAESLIAIEKFDDELRASMRDTLLNSNLPLGRLWLDHRLETFKEMVSQRQEKAHNLCSIFDIPNDHHVVLRTYRVFSRKKKIMLITEMFPLNYLD